MHVPVSFKVTKLTLNFYLEVHRCVTSCLLTELLLPKEPVYTKLLDERDLPGPAGSDVIGSPTELCKNDPNPNIGIK